MPLPSIKTILEQAALVSPGQFETWSKAWRLAVDSGSQDSLVAFFCRERGISEETFLQQLSPVLGWPFLDLRRLTPDNEARKKISTKVAFQYNVIPTSFSNDTLQVAVSNPFSSELLNAVQFDAKCPVQFGL